MVSCIYRKSKEIVNKEETRHFNQDLWKKESKFGATEIKHKVPD